MRHSILLVFAAAQFACSAEPVIQNLWPAEPPGPPAKTTGAEADLTKPGDNFIAGRRLIRLGNVSTPQMHVFLPPADKANGAAIVVCPGGGYNILAWDLEGTEVADWLNSIGVAAIVVKYRVPTSGHKDTAKWDGREVAAKSMGPLMDAQRAVSLVRSRAAEWKLDPGRIGILGFSAGGETAALAAVHREARAYAKVETADAASCAPDFAVLIYPGYLADDTGALRANIPVTRETPPMFFAHAADDPVKCESSIALFLALRKAGVRAEMHIHDRGGHGYGLRADEKAPVTDWPKRCEAWLRAGGWLAPR
jgi:acetyl esterase/lipase